MLVEQDKPDLFSSDAEKLLKQYATRFGVPLLYSTLVRLRTATSNMKPTLDSLTTVDELFTTITRTQSLGAQFTEKEKKMMMENNERLDAIVKDYIMKYNELFPKVKMW